jgi:hypothetical protein
MLCLKLSTLLVVHMQMMSPDSPCSTCPKPEEADDMHLAGVCLKKLGVDVVHSARFHQEFRSTNLSFTISMSDLHVTKAPCAIRSST